MPRLLIGPLLRHVGATDATVWVETDAPCEVEVLGVREHTWTVAGHHYALVILADLEPGSTTPYEVRLDGERAWPPLAGDRPPSIIRTLGDGRRRCGSRSARAGTAARRRSSTIRTSTRTRSPRSPGGWPARTSRMARRAAHARRPGLRRRDLRGDPAPDPRRRRRYPTGAKDQVADFEEYTWLYLESWTDPDVRWLLSTVPSAMIFDDHDVRDDWNTSHAWRDGHRSAPLVGRSASSAGWPPTGSTSTWATCAPDELAENELYQRVRRTATATPSRCCASSPRTPTARPTAPRARGGRYRRDFGRTRLLVIDSRCGRILADGDRAAWSARTSSPGSRSRSRGDYDHLLIGTSLPWLLARALHDLEAWNEALADGAGGQRWARWSEKLRRAADLEHWAAFRQSFERLAGLIARGRPRRPQLRAGPGHGLRALRRRPPRLRRARRSSPSRCRRRVYQLTCSPLHNYVPAADEAGLPGGVEPARRATRVRRLLRRVGPVPQPSLSWERLCGPFSATRSRR